MRATDEDEADWAQVEDDVRSPADVRRAFRKGVLVGCGTGLLGIVALVFIALVALSVMIETGLVPDSMAVRGEDLPASALTFLAEAGLLEEQEQVLYYYCDGLVSFREDGNLFTDRRVISYWEEGEELFVEQATYSEISAIEPIYDDSLFANSQIWVERASGEAFQLIVSNEDDLDEEFVELLIETWTAKR